MLNSNLPARLSSCELHGKLKNLRKEKSLLWLPLTLTQHFTWIFTCSHPCGNWTIAQKNLQTKDKQQSWLLKQEKQDKWESQVSFRSRWKGVLFPVIHRYIGKCSSSIFYSENANIQNVTMVFMANPCLCMSIANIDALKPQNACLYIAHIQISTC